MKRLIAIFISVVFIFVLAACSKQDTLHLGVNAVIQEVDEENNWIIVKGIDDDSFIKDGCEISCSEIEIIYCNYTTGEVKDISIQDLQNGDEIIIGVRESEIAKYVNEQKQLKVEQIQLGTQRLN